MSIFNTIRKYAESLYNNICDIYVFENVVFVNGVSNSFEVLKYQNVSCRISFYHTKNNINNKKLYLHSDVDFNAKLFYPPNIIIPIGSKIIIDDVIYKSVSLPSSYVSHNEVLIAVYKYV